MTFDIIIPENNSTFTGEIKSYDDWPSADVCCTETRPQENLCFEVPRATVLFRYSAKTLDWVRKIPSQLESYYNVEDDPPIKHNKKEKKK